MIVKIPRYIRKRLAKSGNIIQFYKDLGWDPHEFQMNPSELQMSPDYTGKIINNYVKVMPPQAVNEYMMLWVQYGPSSNSALKPRHIRIELQDLKRVIRKKNPRWIVED